MVCFITCSVSQHNLLSQDGSPCVYGTGVAKDLRGGGYAGLLIIRAADAAAEDSARFMKEGSVDGCISKGSSGKETA